ncbi:hypothetical protein N0U24_07835 [Peribacillus frigoritolerans]|uniref:hypothetical protein n=1 Tax=Peribacillus frigoritolerans TaxID=450367 RepID=UPI0021AA10C0|nr:hypothetical protein [Peribacillus frigoritolerans]MCT4477072.1 hypothetical protein [Peribacillus frigoritolerans]
MDGFKNINSIILTASSIGVSIILWRKGQSRKALSYDIFSSTSLFKKHDELGKKLKIFFDDREIKENVLLVLLRIVNTGNVPIEEDDFKKDITIETNNSKILIAEVKETTPKNLYVDIRNDRTGYAAISPLLLNSKEEIIIKLLIKASDKIPFSKDELIVASRIVGVSEITKVKQSSSLVFLMLIIAPTTTFIFSFLTIAFKNIPWLDYALVLPLFLTFVALLLENKRKR